VVWWIRSPQCPSIAVVAVVASATDEAERSAGSSGVWFNLAL
jgi:hypothetical protein